MVSGQERRCAPIQFFSTCRYLAPTARLSTFVKVVQKWLGTNTFVRIKSHTGSKFSRITLWQLYTWGSVVVHPCYGFSLRRQMAPQQNAQFWTVFLVNFASFWGRIASPTIYGSSWMQFSTSVRRIDVLCKALNDSSMAPQDSQKCGGNFPKCKQSNADFVPNTMVTIEIAINSTRGVQHFALHPAGIALPSRWCFWFLVSFMFGRVWRLLV